ncbi:ATP-grasp domain-containing protein [Hymenobacter armeniacus]|uniref:ATP-grasp domain-containing protein n=1 Tax=Hymenobacter armeniacus TaxID=2771358 RepID=A0ABR8JSU8_9BACT|nr:ATP-grasp domain-containing protein [Hymenobacter armeniacus]MBD2722165.1 ATP-grasp domain-containing protein [Hymenobacter armeniacus]
MEKLIVLVLEGEYRLTAAVLFCLSRDERMVVHMVSRDATSPFRYSRYVRSHHRQPQGAFDADFVPFVQQVAARTAAQVLLPIDVEGMRFCIAHHPALETALRVLPLPSAHAYEIAADKSWLAGFMRRHDIPGPVTITNIGQHLPEQLATLRFPVLLKPTGGEGGLGIELFREAAPLLERIAQLPPGAKYIVQTYLEGYDIDCNVLYKDGQLLAYSVQRGLLPAANAYAPTQAIEFVKNDAVLAVVDRLMTALHWNGVAHLDLRYDADSGAINVIEINPRFWLTVVGSAVTAKVNFPVLACLAALNRPVARPAFALGRYIPFNNFLKYKYLSRLRDKVRFTFGNTSLMSFLGDPLPKLFCLFNRHSVRIE